jgi:hypothetical protein
MNTAIQQTITTSYTTGILKTNLFTKFIEWCCSQEKFRFGWLAAIMGIHGCALTPITLFIVVLGGNNIFFWIAAIVAMMMSLVTNLAAMPTKITIPVFILSIAIDITLMTVCIGSGLDFSGTYF